MQAFSIVIRLTGLLFLTPDAPANPTATYALMPAGYGAGGHVAQIGYDKAQAGGVCARGYRAEVDGICYHDIGGWSVRISGTGTVNNGPNHFIPESLARLTRRAGGRTPIDAFRTVTKDSTDARVILEAGNVTGVCTTPDWRFATSPTDTNPSAMELVHQLTWSIARGPNNRLMLTRSRIHGSVDEDQIVELTTRDTAAPIKLFVRNISALEAESTFDHAVEDRGKPVRADHFQALFNYLGIRNPHITVPAHPAFPGECTRYEFDERGNRIPVMGVVGTATCPLGVGP